MKTIVLASLSPRRADLLRQLGLSFQVIESGVVEDEKSDCDPRRLAEKLALSKAMAVAAKVSDGIIIGADTVVSVDQRILAKPSDENEAADMLRQLSGRCHRVLTGLAVIEQPRFEVLTHVESTEVCMRTISEEEITWYLNSGEPYDKAGGYGIQGKAAVFVDRLDGCYYNVVGLPLAALWRMLGSLGIRIWEGAGMNDTKAPDHEGSAIK
jgi:septum formation protein